jgi:endo-1,4-beta-D-glucanase Y
VSKERAKELLSEYYKHCLRPYYKKGYFNSDSEGNSESISYALLQSYYASDPDTFNQVWSRSKQILQRQEDNLLAWKFEYQMSWISFPAKTIKVVDYNSATDADTDIAHALLMAGEKWNRRDYIIEAREIINDIWDKETAELNGKRYVLAGNWANLPDGLVINPSYINPQAYRVFSKYDIVHDWNKVISDNYSLLAEVSRMEGRPGIPPNWVFINKSSGLITAYQHKPDSLDYSYDAFRIYYRVALDQKISPSSEAWNYLSSVRIFEERFRDTDRICTLYYHQDGVFACDVNTTGLAGPLGIFSVTSEFFADQLVGKYYLRDSRLQFPDYSFYAKSWHWFGFLLWSGGYE